MANWVADFFTRNPDMTSLPVAKRARHSIHFEHKNGERIAVFTGSPCHFQDADGLWKPLDTTLFPVSGGFYGAPGLDVLINPDGRVKVQGSDYQQFTYLPGSPLGFLDGDRIVREFPGGRQYLRLLENGFQEQIILDKKTFPYEKFVIQKVGILPSKFIVHPLIATDDKGFQFEFEGDATAFALWLDHAIYPVVIDPDFTESTADGYVYGEYATYATRRSTSVGFDITSTTIIVGQDLWRYEPNRILRSFLKFDTSAIGAGGSVTQVNLKLVCTTDNSAVDFDVQIVKQDWSAQDPITAGNREAAYDNCLAGTADDNIWRNTSGMSLNTQYASGNLATAWVNKTGNTYYSLRSAEDYNNSAPTDDELISLASQDHATAGYRPILTVAYTSGGTSTAHFFSMF